MNLLILLTYLILAILGSTIQALTSSEAQEKLSAIHAKFDGRIIHNIALTSNNANKRSDSLDHIDSFRALHKRALLDVPNLLRHNPSSGCPSNNALREYQDYQRKIQNLHKIRAKSFWKLQADYTTCVYFWSQISQGNYNVLPYVAPNIGGVAHPADWMGSTNMTFPDGTNRYIGIINTFGYSHGTYCAVHPERQVSPGFIQAVYINELSCEGGFCNFDVTSETATFPITLPNGTVIPSFLANLTIVLLIKCNVSHQKFTHTLYDKNIRSMIPNNNK